MKLNLEVTTKEEQKVKAYLEANASEILAEKINNGVRIQKDGKTLLNKKTLSGFMQYACEEAKKQAEKGARSACIDDDTVYGWAVHYFEEDSIEGTLYNEDGTQYKAPMPKKAPVTTKYEPPKPKPKPQMSIFDMVPADKEEASDIVSTNDDEEPTDEDYAEAAEATAAPEPAPKQKQAKPPVSPVYQKYLDVQERYPQAIVAMRLGDFYEVFGENAVTIGNALDLTITSRDCGLESRIPMIGFPYHASDVYFEKILGRGHTVVVLENDAVRELPSVENVDLETGEILSEEEMREFDGDIDESIPTVSKILAEGAPLPRSDDVLAKDISDALDDESDFDMSAFCPEAVAILSDIFGDEIELR